MTKTTILSGIRAGRVTSFCKAMGWSVRPYQTILVERMMNRSRYKQFIEIAPPKTFDQIWEAWDTASKDKEWTHIFIEECAFAPHKMKLPAPEKGVIVHRRIENKIRGMDWSMRRGMLLDELDKYCWEPKDHVVHPDHDHQLDAYRYAWMMMNEPKKPTLWQRIKQFCIIFWTVLLEQTRIFLRSK